MVKRKFTTD